MSSGTSISFELRRINAGCVTQLLRAVYDFNPKGENIYTDDHFDLQVSCMGLVIHELRSECRSRSTLRSHRNVVSLCDRDLRDSIVATAKTACNRGWIKTGPLTLALSHDQASRRDVSELTGSFTSILARSSPKLKLVIQSDEALNLLKTSISELYGSVQNYGIKDGFSLNEQQALTLVYPLFAAGTEAHLQKMAAGHELEQDTREYFTYLESSPGKQARLRSVFDLMESEAGNKVFSLAGRVTSEDLKTAVQRAGSS